MKGSDKTDQDFKVGILNEDRKVDTYSGQSGSGSAGAREARLLFLKIFFLLKINGQQRQVLFLQ